MLQSKKQAVPCKYLLIVILVGLTSTSAMAAGVNQYYVSRTGSDSNDGYSYSSAWATIQHAVEEAAMGPGGAVIHVAPGIYSHITTSSTCPACTCSGLGFGNVNVCVDRGGSSPLVRLMIQCDQKWQCKISGGLYGFLVAANNVDVTGFDIGNTSGMASAVLSITRVHSGHADVGNSLHVIGNYIHDLGSSAYGPEGIGCPQTGAVDFNNRHGAYMTDEQAVGNLIARMGRYPFPTCHNTHGIYDNTSGATLENNIIAQVPSAGVMVATAGCGTRVSNNTVMSAQTGVVIYGSNASTDGCAYGVPGLNTVNNNIIVNMSLWKFQLGAPSSPQCTSATPNYFGNNVTDGVGKDFFSGPYYCDRVSPSPIAHASPTSLFSNYQPNGSGNYALKSSAPAVNSGTTHCVSGQSACVPPLDFRSIPRPQGAAIDVGAYEYY